MRRRPLVVGGDPRGRGVVATANYVARRFGIHSAMSCGRGAAALPATSSSCGPGTRSTGSTRRPSGRRRARSSRASSGPGSTRATSTSARSRDSFAGARRLAEAVQVGGARLDVPHLLARRLDVEGRVQGRLGPAQARRDHRRAARPRGPLPGAVRRRASCRASARAPRSGSRAAGVDDDRRARGARRRRAPRACCPGRSAGCCATARAASTRATSSWTSSGSRSRPRRRSSATSPTVTALHAELRRMAADVSASTSAATGISARTVTTKLRYADFSIRISLDDALADADRRARADRRPRLPAPRPRPPRPTGRAAPRRCRRLRSHRGPAADPRRALTRPAARGA